MNRLTEEPQQKCFAYILFAVIHMILFILLLMCLKGSFTVHAEEANGYTYYINFSYSATFEDDSKNNSGSYEYIIQTTDYPVACRYDEHGYIYVLSYDGNKAYNIHPTTTDFTQSGNRDYAPNSYNNGISVDYFDTASTFTVYGAKFTTCSLDTNIPIFPVGTDLLNYFRTGDTTGQLNKPSININDSDKKDTSYSLTGFLANKDITATWTGTTQRSKLTETNVHEYVRAFVGYAYKNAPGQIATTTEYDEFFETSGKTATIDWNSIQPDDDTMFLQSVAFYPIYTEDEGFFGTFYYGTPSVITFALDGSIDSIETPEEINPMSGAILVTANVNSSYTIMLPATLALTYNQTSGKYEGNYTVSVKANLTDGEAVKVVPNSTVTLTNEGGDSADGEVTQAINTWKLTKSAENEIASDYTQYVNAVGHVSADLTKAGSYSGTLDFTFTKIQ